MIQILSSAAIKELTPYRIWIDLNTRIITTHADVGNSLNSKALQVPTVYFDIPIGTGLGGFERPPSTKLGRDHATAGSVSGVPLSLTDGTALQGGRWAFSAVAESTDDSYLDGACVGCAIGIVAPDGQIQSIHPIEGAPKVEGIAVLAQGADWVFTLVTDPDDPKVPAQLLQTQLAHQS